MNAPLKFDSATAQVDQAAIAPLPNSRKVYIEGSRPDVRVPMREISQSPTPASFGGEPNPPLYVYDTSCAYTDPSAAIDIRSGLPSGEFGLSSAAGRRRDGNGKLSSVRFAIAPCGR